MSTDRQKTTIAERPAAQTAADQTKRNSHQSFQIVQQLRQNETVYAVVTPVVNNEHFVRK